MTSFTSLTKLLIMNIIAAMAGNAGTRCRSHFVNRLAVAGFAIDFGVLAIQFETGLVMVKSPQFPAVWVMALLAVLTETLLVRIIFLMA